MPSSFDKDLIEPIRNSEASHSEPVNEHRMNGAFVLRAGITSHQELSGRDENHIGFEDHLLDHERRRIRAVGMALPYRRAMFTITGCPDFACGL